VAQELARVLRDTFPKSIEVRLTTADNLWNATGDTTQLHQVLLNLCVNARDAMPNGGQLTIALENVTLDETYAAMNLDARPGRYVLMQVVDTGAGIAPDVQERIFEPFFTTKEVGKGTGLGLSTTLAIIKGHGGYIHVYSEVGSGTAFKVYLPARSEADGASVSSAELAAPPRGNGEVVLVVDDEPVIRAITRRTLEAAGYDVMLASNGAEAVAAYAQHMATIAIVLTDMAMPVMGGEATIVALRSMNPLVKVICSSGVATDDAVARALGVGGRHFLAKPYTAETVLNALHEVLYAS
jgi:CheY-like chemotaxis protein